MLQKLLGQIREKLDQRQLFYVCNDPERALGLEGMLPNYHIVCIDDSPLIDQLLKKGVSVFCLERALGKQNAVFRSSLKLLEHPRAREFITEKSASGKPLIIVFKSSPAIEKAALEIKVELLNPFAKINARFEQKLSQYKILQPLGIPFPETILGVFGKLSYSEITHRLGQKFILQFDRGHTGEGTILIDRPKTYEALQRQFPRREIRCSRYISGPAYTVNCCTGRQGTSAAGLSYQITGEPTCTSGRFSTCGNDFTDPFKEFAKIRLELTKMADLVGKALAEADYRGLFGLDTVYNRENGKLYFVETNVRQPASITFHTELQLAKDQVPLLLYHYCELLGVTYPEPKIRYDLHALPAFQVFLRNTREQDVVLKQNSPRGIYNMQNMKWLKDGYRYEDIVDDTQFLFTSISAGRKVSPNSQIARIQARRSLLGPDGLLSPVTAEFTKYLSERLLK